MRYTGALSSLGVGKGAAALIAGGVVALGVGTMGFVFSPFSVSATGGGKNVLSENNLPEHRREIVEGLRRIIESSKAVIDARPAPGSRSSDLVLWTEDRDELGLVNENEVLILTHSHVLEAVVAVAKATENSAGAMPTDALFDSQLATRWRMHPDVRTNVLATDVKTITIESAFDGSSEPSLLIRLTWSGAAVDEGSARLSETMFSVAAPRVQRSR